MDEIEKIKSELVKKATGFKFGGFKPTNSISESWIGRVYLYLENEEIPLDNQGRQMFPLFQIYLKNLPFIPEILKETELITAFISQDFPMDLNKNGNNWILREYSDISQIVIKDLKNENSYIKPFPLSHHLIEKDYPVWEDQEISEDITDRINEMEDSGIIESYYDVVENHYEHKIGGYAAYCQSGINFGEDYEFVIQIASDEKAHLNIVDSGKFYFAKNRKTGEWLYYIDFY
ncbi:DUF1963 domain-containing protein [Flavobacterium ginsengiterrae]|uniref:DUF1963 domain-containing protein n=1 Tax=Flavobacterium ginsengiterrae TaxID=871695 RepID=A0ABP7GWV6_9FLAO